MSERYQTKRATKNVIVGILLLAILSVMGAPAFAENTVATYAVGETVYVGGMPIGVTIQMKSVMVVGKGEVITDCGSINPTRHSDIEVGDYLLELNGVQIHSTEDLTQFTKSMGADAVRVKIKRTDEMLETLIIPALDIASNTYKLGLWVRDNTAGVGTVTYYRGDGSFAALGHPITDSTTGKIIKVTEGDVYHCQIIGVNKGVKGKAGELKGMFNKASDKIGCVKDNNEYGLYGKLDKLPEPSAKEPLIASGRKCAHPGKAEIITTIGGDSPKAYQISIVKCCRQDRPTDRSMVIKVTDPELLEKSGGIVQGMSGSPILQDGKLIGAVTHV